MAYVVPQVLVFQEFTLVPSEIAQPLRAWIAGPHAALHRYSDASEKAGVNLGAYDSTTDASYDWPGRTAGSVVDADYVKLFIDDALLEFLNNPFATTTGLLAPVSGFNNRVRSDTYVFADNGASYPRTVLDAPSGAIIKRGVKVGDHVHVRGNGTGNPELTTTVKDLVAEVVAASVGFVANDDSNETENAAAVGAGVQWTRPVGSGMVITCAAAGGSQLYAYDGLADGDVDETYTLTCTKAALSADVTDARFNLVSASGNDNELDIQPGAAGGTGQRIGARGLSVIFSAADIAIGDSYTVDIKQAFESAHAVGSGTYTGAADTTYIVECVKGGLFASADAPVIDVTTSTGSDSSVGTIFTASGVAHNIGTKGVQLMFEGEGLPTAAEVIVGITAANPAIVDMGSIPGSYSGGDTVHIFDTGMASIPDGVYIIGTISGNTFDLKDADGAAVDSTGDTFVSGATIHEAGAGQTLLHLVKGDKWYVPATAASAGKYQTLVLNHNMSAALLASTDMDIEISIKKDIEVDKNRVGYSPNVNWETSATKLTSKSGIVAVDAGYDVDTDLPVKGGTLFAQYREWLAALIGSVYSISDVGEIAVISGALDPDNPLKWGVFKALTNSNGTVVKYSAIADPDVSSKWSDALGLIDGREDVYGLVPLTRNQTVLDLFSAHVNSQSSETAGRWRVAWFNLLAKEEIARVDAVVAGSPVTAVLSNDADGDAKVLSIDSANVDLTALGVLPGDIVRYIYGNDGFGTETYTEFVVDSVTNSVELILFSAHSQPIVSSQVEIYHNQTKPEIAAALGSAAGAFSNRRVRAVWPDVVDGHPGYFLCAALAGYASGVVPHRPLTNAGISGFSDLSRSVDFFNASNFNAMAEKGAWIVTIDDDGNVVSRHGLTTDTTDLNSSEEQVVRNVDSMSYLFLNRLAPFIGQSAVTPSLIAQLHTELGAALEFLKGNHFSETLGSQLIDGEVRTLEVHPLLKDRLVAVLDLEIPYALNNIEVHLTV